MISLNILNFSLDVSACCDMMLEWKRRGWIARYAVDVSESFVHVILYAALAVDADLLTKGIIGFPFSLAEATDEAQRTSPSHCTRVTTASSRHVAMLDIATTRYNELWVYANVSLRRLIVIG
jgi:hypothetical protein